MHEAYYNRGVALGERGILEEALASFDQALALKPDYAEAHNKRGIILGELGRLDAALVSFDQAIAIKPSLAEAHFNRGIVLGNMMRFDEAQSSYNQAIELKPDYVEAFNNLGVLLAKAGQFTEAVANYRKAITLKPDHSEAFNNLGMLLADAGQLTEAATSYQRAIDLKPNFSACYLNRSNLKKYEADDPDIPALRRILDNATNDNDKICAGFALAKACNDLKKYDEAFALYTEANRRQKSQLGYSIERDRQGFARIRSLFSQLPVTSPVPFHSSKPILIVGMPRSGTTLAEQILASHSEVFGAGELGTLSLLVRNEFVAGIVGNNLAVSSRKIAEGYLVELERLAQGRRFVTDKMPLNFRWLGFLLLALPDLRVVRMSRDPMAVCWSNFKQRYDVHGLGFAYDLADLAEYHRMYEELMRFWEERFPGRIYVLNYESLTRHQERETRDLLAYCGLEWQDRCLEFDRLKRVVHTASTLQVRKKIYQGSSEAWRRYEHHLKPLLETLRTR